MEAAGPPSVESKELEQFPSEQLWLQAFGFDSFNGMYFSRPLLVLYQHLRRPQQYPNNPGTCSANGRHSATSHSWTAHFSMEFSAIKRPRCCRMVLFVRKMGVLEQAPWTQTLGWIFAHRRFYMREGSWDIYTPVRRRGREGWAGHREKPARSWPAGASEPSANPMRTWELGEPQTETRRHMMSHASATHWPQTFSHEELNAVQGRSHQLRAIPSERYSYELICSAAEGGCVSPEGRNGVKHPNIHHNGD